MWTNCFRCFLHYLSLFLSFFRSAFAFFFYYLSIVLFHEHWTNNEGRASSIPFGIIFHTNKTLTSVDCIRITNHRNDATDCVVVALCNKWAEDWRLDGTNMVNSRRSLVKTNWNLMISPIHGEASKSQQIFFFLLFCGGQRKYLRPNAEFACDFETRKCQNCA